MSARDIAFIQRLPMTGAEVARLLEISRQSVSRGLRSDSDYLDENKLKRISEVAPKVLDIEARKIAKLITEFYPNRVSGIKRAALAEQANISIDSDFYFCCNKLPYYMNVYERMFRELAAYLKECQDQKLFFAFPDRDNLRYSQGKIQKWLSDPQLIGQASVIVCPTIQALPFSVAGYERNKPVVYFCGDKGFAAQNEINSRHILDFIKGNIADTADRLKPLASTGG
jgi:transcriptional regulator with XRE-family HTH domain